MVFENWFPYAFTSTATVQYCLPMRVFFRLVCFIFATSLVFMRDCESHIYIRQGRHPVIDNPLIENEQFVPNDTDMNIVDNI